ncbi:MAG TPA: TonB C-terminal domain-containing protein [Candidatus Acidoferrales bacterium]|nr:TonB C-terminal domain-containing protein [Candidatus Acidoferrales bacterium]
MIPRTLVPLKITRVDPSAPPENGARRTSQLDSRIVVPSGPATGLLDARTSIPAYMPLDVLSSRVLIPRDMPVKQMEGSATAIPSHVPLAVLETRVVVPQEARLEESFRPAAQLPPGIFDDILERDLFNTGEVNLLASPDDSKKRDWQWLIRSFSLIVHVAVILLILFAPRLFTYRAPAQQVNLAREQLSRVFLPPSVKNIPRQEPPPERPSARMRLDPRVLKKLLPTPEPPTPEPMAGPKTPAPPQPEPTRAAQAQSPPAQPTKPAPAFKSLSQLENPPPKPNQKLNLDLPRLSPGRALQENAQRALQNRNSSTSAAFSEAMPLGPGAPLPSGNNGQGLLGSGVQILTPTQGVDFSNYLARLLARVKQNWYSVMPISARMGDKGVVVMRFHIMRNGDMPNTEPMLERTSGKEPLDRAAGAALTESNPFEPLPSAFTGPYIELRIAFLYNLPLDYNFSQ